MPDAPKASTPRVSVTRVLMGAVATALKFPFVLFGATAALLALIASALSALDVASATFELFSQYYSTIRTWVFSHIPFHDRLPPLTDWQKDVLTVEQLLAALFASSTVRAADSSELRFLVLRWLRTYCAVVLTLLPVTLPIFFFGLELERTFYLVLAWISGFALLGSPVALVMGAVLDAHHEDQDTSRLDSVLSTHLRPAWARTLFLVAVACASTALLILVVLSPAILLIAGFTAIYTIVVIAILGGMLLAPPALAVFLGLAAFSIGRPVDEAPWRKPLGWAVTIICGPAALTASFYIWQNWVAPSIQPIIRNYDPSNLIAMVQPLLDIVPNTLSWVAPLADDMIFRNGIALLLTFLTVTSAIHVFRNLLGLPQQDRTALAKSFRSNVSWLITLVVSTAIIMQGDLPSKLQIDLTAPTFTLSP